MKLQEVLNKAFEKFEKFDVNRLLPHLTLANEGAIGDVLNKTGNGYYQFLPCLIEVLQPKQIVELGGAMGVACLCMLHGTDYQNFELHSITLEEHGLEFSYIDKEYSNFHPVVGDDLNLDNWLQMDVDFVGQINTGPNLVKTDLWFIDSLHEEAQLRAELELYKQFFKSGAIILFDDIFLNEGMRRVWDDMDNILKVKEKRDLTYPCHWSGFGLIEVA